MVVGFFALGLHWCTVMPVVSARHFSDGVMKGI